MIQVDISNIWGPLSLPDLLAIEQEVSQAFEGLTAEALPWLTDSEEETARLEAAARRIRQQSQVCVVMGLDGGCLGARAAIEFLRGTCGDPDREGLRLLFAGDSFSTVRWSSLLQQLEDRDVSLIAVSATGTETEPAIAFRSLRWMLERKYGTDEAGRRIYAVTAPGSPLAQMAAEKGWETFSFSGGGPLTPAGLLPMAAAGLDIRQLLQGAAETKEACAEHSLENPVWQYAAVRNMMLRAGMDLELLVSFEPDFAAFGGWWQQLFAGAEAGGIFPAAVRFPSGLHWLDRRIREGRRELFETLLRFDPPEQQHAIGSDWKDLDRLNYLEGKTLDQVEQQACQAALDTHVDSGVPVITVDCGPREERTLGSLFWFFRFSCALSARILGEDPFRPEEEAPWQSAMAALLGRPDPGL